MTNKYVTYYGKVFNKVYGYSKEFSATRKSTYAEHLLCPWHPTVKILLRPHLSFPCWFPCMSCTLETHITGQKNTHSFQLPTCHWHSLTPYRVFSHRTHAPLPLLSSCYTEAGLPYPTYPHENKSLCFSFFCLRKMKVHLITIKIRIVGCTDTLVKSEGPVRLDLGLWNTKKQNRRGA